MYPSPSSLSHDFNSDWPFAFRKSIHSTRNPYPILIILSYPIISFFVCTIVPRTIHEALDHHRPQHALATMAHRSLSSSLWKEVD